MVLVYANSGTRILLLSNRRNIGNDIHDSTHHHAYPRIKILCMRSGTGVLRSSSRRTLAKMFSIRIGSFHLYRCTRSVYVVFTKIPLLCVCYSVEVALNVSTRVVPRNDCWKLMAACFWKRARDGQGRWSLGRESRRASSANQNAADPAIIRVPALLEPSQEEPLPKSHAALAKMCGTSA